jgi:hypothetical protein
MFPLNLLAAAGAASEVTSLRQQGARGAALNGKSPASGGAGRSLGSYVARQRGRGAQPRQ